MRILTLFIALFLTFLPESAPFEGFSQVQDVCCEDVEGFEEEAVIRTVVSEQCPAKESSKSRPTVFSRYSSDIAEPNHHNFCFERQWLAHCRLRL